MSEGIGFLMSDVSRLMRRRFDDRARAIGVTRAQWRVLVALRRYEGPTQGKLAEVLEVEPISLSRMIDRLVEAGHVERRADPADRRAWRIHLTAKALPLIDRLRHVGDDVLDDALVGIDDARQRALVEMLYAIHANLSQSPSEGQAAHG